MMVLAGASGLMDDDGRLTAGEGRLLGSLSLSGWGRRHWPETGLAHLDLPAMFHHRRLSRPARPRESACSCF